jgi:hypothetical protein
MGIPAGQDAAQHSRIIDASVHVFFESNGDMRSFMQEPFKSRGIPDVEMDWYGAPGGEYVPWAERPAPGRRSLWRPHVCGGTWPWTAARRRR